MIYAFFHTIAQQWAQTLRLFFPENFKLYLLVSLKTFFRSTKKFFICFWWLLLLWASCRLQIVRNFILHNEPLQIFGKTFSPRFFDDLLLACVMIVILICVILTVRPSITEKNCRYYISQMGAYRIPAYIIIFFLFNLIQPQLSKLAYGQIVSGLLTLIPLNWSFVFAYLLSGNTIGLLHLGASNFALSPLFIYALLFLLDAQPNFGSIFTSIINSVKLLIYTYPWSLFFSALFLLSKLGLVMLSGAFFNYIDMSFYHVVNENILDAIRELVNAVLAVLLWLFAASWCNTLYVQRVQRQLDLYRI